MNFLILRRLHFDVLRQNTLLMKMTRKCLKIYLLVYKDGLLRMMSELTNAVEADQFCFPTILPMKHLTVRRHIRTTYFE